MVAPTKTKVEHNGDMAVMRFEEDITSTSEEAVLGSYKALPAGTTKILLDFAKVPYLNSSGIALVIQLMMAASKVSAEGVVLWVDSALCQGVHDAGAGQVHDHPSVRNSGARCGT